MLVKHAIQLTHEEPRELDPILGGPVVCYEAYQNIFIIGHYSGWCVGVTELPPVLETGCTLSKIDLYAVKVAFAVVFQVETEELQADQLKKKWLVPCYKR